MGNKCAQGQRSRSHSLGVHQFFKNHLLRSCCWFMNLRRTSFITSIITSLVSLFTLFDPLFLTLPTFAIVTPKRWKNLNKIPLCRILCWIFWKKDSFKKSEDFRSSLDLESYQCGHPQTYNFFPVFADFRTLPGHTGNENGFIWRKKISCYRGINSRLSQKEWFLEPIKKKYLFHYLLFSCLVGNFRIRNTFMEKEVIWKCLTCFARVFWILFWRGRG